MSNCETKGCKHKARFAVRINVPAMGWAIDMHQPLQALLGIKLCKDCFDQMKVKELLFPVGGGDSIGDIFKMFSKSLCPPDFERAWISKVSLDSEEWRDFEEATKTKGDLQ